MLFRPIKNLKELLRILLEGLRISMREPILWLMAHLSPETKGTELGKHRHGDLEQDGEIIMMEIIKIKRRGDRHFRAKDKY
jgi:hypothetical protein